MPLYECKTCSRSYDVSSRVSDMHGGRCFECFVKNTCNSELDYDSACKQFWDEVWS